MKRNKPLASLAVALALLMPGAARAVDAQSLQPQASEEPPWSRNVPKQRQDTAQRLLDAGNDLMKKSALVKAEAKYREALTYWDHPGIHYNLALALFQLDRPVEVYEHLTKALLHEAAPLGTEKYQHALILKGTLEKQLAWLELSCETPGAVVTIDGQHLPLVDGRFEGRLRSGKVTLVATREGYQPRRMDLTLASGEKHPPIRFRLYTDVELTEYRPRWAPWKPWAVVGAGAALAMGGGLLNWQARQGYRDFDAHVLECAQGAPDGGCREPELDARRGRLEMQNKLSLGTMVTGGAAVLSGTVLLLLNHSEPHRRDPDELDRQRLVAVTPLLGSHTQGLLLTFLY